MDSRCLGLKRQQTGLGFGSQGVRKRSGPCQRLSALVASSYSGGISIDAVSCSFSSHGIVQSADVGDALRLKICGDVKSMGIMGCQ